MQIKHFNAMVGVLKGLFHTMVVVQRQNVNLFFVVYCMCVYKAVYYGFYSVMLVVYRIV